VFENCIFAGTITGDKTTNCGGFVGWNNGSITYTDCLQKGTLSLKTTEGSATFNRGTAPAGGSSNYYYLTPYGTAQGTQVFTITTTGCTVTATATVSDGSTDYYAASTEVTLSHADQTGYSFDGYTVTKVGTNPAETVDVNENTFQMPASNVTVTVAWSLSKESITLAHAQQTFSCSQALDFTDVTGLAAYIASGYDDGKVILSRVKKVPAGTGLLIVGTEGETYQIPYATVNTVYSNFLKPVLEAQTVPQTDGSYTNFLYGEQEGVKGFYKSSGSGTVGAQKAYLQLPTLAVPTNARRLTVVFDEEATGLAPGLAPKTKESWHTLDGRKLSTKPTRRGVYIHDGKQEVVR
jgi:Tfp pilus assembly protein PilX